ERPEAQDRDPFLEMPAPLDQASEEILAHAEHHRDVRVDRPTLEGEHLPHDVSVGIARFLVGENHLELVHYQDELPPVPLVPARDGVRHAGGRRPRGRGRPPPPPAPPRPARAEKERAPPPPAPPGARGGPPPGGAPSSPARGGEGGPRPPRNSPGAVKPAPPPPRRCRPPRPP